SGSDRQSCDNYIEFNELPLTACGYVRLTMTDWPRKPGENLGTIEFTAFGKPVETHGPRIARYRPIVPRVNHIRKVSYT
ncbi:MAG: hypothetical protein ACJ74Y_05650, partial [Bryobacteraceae bacterium]